MRNLFANFVHLMKNRFVIFFIFSATFVVVQYFSFSSFLPSTETKDLWFYSGIFMVLFSILFIEPYYTSPKNVITNVIPLLLVFIAVKTYFDNQVLWWVVVIILLALLLASIIAMALDDKDKSPDHPKNRASNILKSIVVTVGQGKVLYSSVFIYFLLTYHKIQDSYTLTLFILWFFILCINPKNIHNSFMLVVKKNHGNQIGEIFGVQSKKTFLVKLFEDRKSIKKFDIVKFKYSMQDVSNLTIAGIVFDTYLLNQEKWAKVLQLGEPKEEDTKLESNVVYKTSGNDEMKAISKGLRVDDFVGIIIEGSAIGKIRFEYSKKKDDLQEGDLLELEIGDKRLFYQVIAGTTKKEKLEDRNETGFFEGEAIQLGELQDDKLSFQKFGWVPTINTPIFSANTSNLSVQEFSYPEYRLGVIPNTALPSVINLNEAISHHMALLGVTGSGKSYLARAIIKEIQNDTKIICIDFNKEFIATLNPSPLNIIEDSQAKSIATKIDWINNELEKFGNLQNKERISKEKSEIKATLKSEIYKFINDQTCNIKVFELPDVSNTTGVLDYTKNFFRVLFEVAKEMQMANCAAKICVVLEEAHTIIPEWNFAGASDKTSQSLVNSIGQIALQGRKYGVGFLVIAQRTANVSKTVLTQCNTVICFQAFDETSFNFLGNYVGKDMVQALPNLKQYHAVVTGKAMRSNMPMIVDLTRK